MRRRRIIAAATALSGRGYDACQIRGVAKAAGVAASTVYSYFPSKDDLLLACLHQWLCDFESNMTSRAGEKDPRARLLDLTSVLISQLTRSPLMADAMVRPYLCADAPAAHNADVVRRRLTAIFLTAMPDWRPTLSQHVAELFADVCVTNIPSIAQQRTTVPQLMQRLSHTLRAIDDHHREGDMVYADVVR